MKTTVKALIAGIAVAAGALVSTGASAQSLFELHEQHKAQIRNFLFGRPSVGIAVGPGYGYAPGYAAAPGYAPGYDSGYAPGYTPNYAPAPAYAYPPAYAPAPVYVAPPPVYVRPYGGYYGYAGPRGYVGGGYGRGWGHYHGGHRR